jgi:nucleoside-diphosphate kinase
MYDLKNKRVFMKRMAVEGVSTRELFIGSYVNVHSRQLKLVDYADVFTK